MPINSNGFSDFWGGLGNQFTGNLDWQRHLQMVDKEFAFNREEAAKIVSFPLPKRKNRDNLTVKKPRQTALSKSV